MEFLYFSFYKTLST